LIATNSNQVQINIELLFFNLFQDDFLALKNESDLDDLCDLSTDDSLTENEKMIVGSQETWDPDV
jgi:hypothetical protein